MAIDSPTSAATPSSPSVRVGLSSTRSGEYRHERASISSDQSSRTVGTRVEETSVPALCIGESGPLQTRGAKITKVLLLFFGRDLGDTAPAWDSVTPNSRYMNVFGRPPTDRRTGSRDGPENGTNARMRQVESSTADCPFPIYEHLVGRTSVSSKPETVTGRATGRSRVRLREPREPRNGRGSPLVGQESTSAGRSFG